MIGLIPVIASISAGILLCLLFYYLIAPRIFRCGLLRRRSGKVFASYSNKDKKEVKLVGQVVKGLGGELIQDRTHIRGGENWRERLNQLIEESDKFQLFWSRNAMESGEVENEWRYALTLKHKNFIFPIYWDKRLKKEKKFPPELSHLQFIYVGLNPATNEVSVSPSLAVVKGLPAAVIITFMISLTSVMAATFWSVKRVTAPKRQVVLPSVPVPSPSPFPASSKSVSPTPTPSPSSTPSLSPTPISPPEIVAAIHQDTHPSKKGERVVFTIEVTNKGGSVPKDLTLRFGVSELDDLDWVVTGFWRLWGGGSFADDDPSMKYLSVEAKNDPKPGETITIRFEAVLKKDLTGPVKSELTAVGYVHNRTSTTHDYKRKKTYTEPSKK